MRFRGKHFRPKLLNWCMVSSEVALSILKASPIPIAVFGFSDDRYILLFANTAYLELFGIRDADIVNKSVSDIFLSSGIHVKDDFIPGLVQSLQKVFESGLPDRIGNAELSIHYQDKEVPETLYIDVENTPVKEDGVVKYVSQSVLQHQITGVSFRSTEPGSEPRNRAELIETILQNLPIGISVNRIDSGEATLVNRQFSETYGWSEKDLIDIKSFFDKVYPESIYRKKILKRVMDDINSGDASRMEWENIEVTTSTGEKKIINAKNIPLFDQNLMISTVVDITLQARQAAEIRRTKVNQEALINSSDDLIWSVDTGGKIITANRALLNNLKHATGRDMQEGDSVQDNIFGDESNKKWKAYYDRTLQGENFTVKEQFFNPLKNRIDYSVVSFSPMRNEQGEIFGAACYSKEITKDTLALIDLQKARNETHKIMESSLDVICTIDAYGCFVSVSAAANQIWGYTPEELVGRRYMELVYEEDKPLTIEASRNIMGGTEMTNFENRYVRKDGSLISIVWSARWDDTDQIMYCIAKDATERNRADYHLKMSEKRYRSLVENGADAVVILDPIGKPLYVSPSITRVLGYTEDETMSLVVNDLVHPSDREAVAERMYEALQHPGETISGHTARIKHKDGSWRWLEATLTNMIHDPMINGIVDNFRDVTKRKEAELEKNLLINNTEESFVLLNRDLEIVSFNDQFEKLYKNYFNKVIEKGQSILIYAQPERRSIVSGIYSRVLQGESETSEINVADPSSNEKKVFSIKFKPVKNSEGEIIGAFVTAIDITERQLALEKLTESEERYKLLFQSSPVPNFVYDLDNFQILDVNDTATEHYGYSRTEFLSKSILDITAEHERKRILEIHKHIQISERVVNFGMFVHLKKNGGFIQSDVSGYKINFGGRDCMMTSCNDVTEREKAFQRVRENESKLLASQKIAKVGYWQSFPDTKGLYWSDEVYNIWGLDKQTFNLDYDALFNTIHPDDREEFLRSRERTFKDGVQRDVEHRIILPDGTIKWVHALGNLIKNDQGGIMIFEGTVQDITERKNLEVLLEKSNSLAEIGSWELDIQSNSLYWSSITKQIHEMDADFEPDVETAINFYPEGFNRDSVRNALEQSLNNGTAWDMELQIVTGKGNERWVRAIGETECINGKCVKLYGSFQNITNRKVAELELLKIYDEKNTILESIQDGFFAVDKNWIVNYWNREAEKLLGKTKNQTLGNHLWKVFANMTDSSSYSKYQEAIDTNQVVHFEDYYPPMHKWYEISAYPSVDGLSVFFKDITERRIYDTQLKDLNRVLRNKVNELAISNRELEEFAYVASHDLQEPLRMISSFLTQLQRKYNDQLDPKAHQYINFAVDGAKRMRQIILDLLDFSRVGRGDAEIESVNLNEVINEILVLFRKNIEESKALFVMSDLPSINIPKASIRQLMQNLISNAIKYQSPENSPLIEIGFTETPEYWEFWVRDNGIGISPDYFDKIFIIFQRLHTKDQYSGTGMGLAICRKIVENLGGKLWIESEEGKGSTFYFTVPKFIKPE